MSLTDPQDADARERAREALAGPGRLARSAISQPADQSAVNLPPAELDQRRSMAQAAMEGYERRERRKALAAQQAAAEATKKKLAADLMAQREAERETREAQKRLVEERQLQADREKKLKLQKITEAQAVIEHLKQEPTVSLKPLRTYKSDLDEHLPQDGNINLGATVLKNQRYYSTPTLSSASVHRTWLLLAAAGFLLLAGGSVLALSWYWFKPSTRTTPAAATIKIRMILPVEDQKELILTDRNQFELRDQMYDLKTMVGRQYATAGGGRLLNLYPTVIADATGHRRQTGLNSFLAAFNIELPAAWRLAISDTFMIGLYQAPRPAFF